MNSRIHFMSTFSFLVSFLETVSAITIGYYVPEATIHYMHEKPSSILCDYPLQDILRVLVIARGYRTYCISPSSLNIMNLCSQYQKRKETRAKIPRVANHLLQILKLLSGMYCSSIQVQVSHSS